MGHSKIFTKPTPVLRKKMGQFAKLFGLWENSKLKDAVAVRTNPQPVIRDGAPDFLSQNRGVRTRFVNRRQTVLNRHLTEIISDALAINFKPEIERTGITITSIETKAWNKGVRIYYSRDGPYDENIQRELLKLEAPIRYSISERHLIARAPKVNFVYDASIEYDRRLDEAIAKASENNPGKIEETALAGIGSTQLTSAKNFGSEEDRLVSKKFIAPADMDNTICGLNYPELYDEVVLNLTRGRGESSRMAANQSYLSISKPLFRDTSSRTGEEEDPMKRILDMKKFLVSQKLKAEHKSRIRRKEELLSVNQFKWTYEGAEGCSDEDDLSENSGDIK